MKSELSSLLTQGNTMFSLPTVCLFSQTALSNEYSNEKDIAPFVYPATTSLEHITMLIGMLQSLLRVVDETPSDDEEEETHDEWCRETCFNEQDTAATTETETETETFAILGMNTFKVALWNEMCDHYKDGVTHKDDLCLIIIVSSKYADGIITSHMQLLKKSLFESQIVNSNHSADKIGSHLVTLAHYWFGQIEDIKEGQGLSL
ncbi:hypothetical protein BDF14DRAFT_1774598 [Spinellus fusiger]|nr:hypothetical protein BDF14DRAFT_1774598 [Spinellus fusiger]